MNTYENQTLKPLNYRSSTHAHTHTCNDWEALALAHIGASSYPACHIHFFQGG